MAKKEEPSKLIFEDNIVVDKPWGREVWYAVVPKKYIGKVLYINKGHRTSLHYHEKKDETLYVWNGQLQYRWIDESGRQHDNSFGFNSRIRIKPGVKHSLGAGHHTVILFEVSTCHPDDSVRVKDYYGRECDG